MVVGDMVRSLVLKDHTHSGCDVENGFGSECVRN